MKRSLPRFAPEEAHVIRTAVQAGEVAPSCPRCKRPLNSSLPLAGGGSIAMVWELRCDACRRSIVVRDLEHAG